MMGEIVSREANADQPDPRTRQPGLVLAELPKICLQSVWLHAITERQCVEAVFNEIDEGRGGFIHTINLDLLRRLTGEPEYIACCRAPTIRTADGMPLVWASRLQRTPLPERVSGSSLIWSLSEAAAQRDRSVFLLGGAPGTAAKTAELLSERFRGLRVAGMCTPSLERGADPRIQQVRQQLLSAKPDIVYVALGTPKQEEVIDALRNSLPTCWWVGVGIAFSFVAGEVRRAPRWMQQSGLEWFHRLLQEPRLAKRYAIDCVPFGLMLLKASFEARFARQRHR